MVLYKFLHKVWVVKWQIFVQTAAFSISFCIFEAKFCWTFGLVIFNFLPDRQILQVRSDGLWERLCSCFRFKLDSGLENMKANWYHSKHKQIWIYPICLNMIQTMCHQSWFHFHFINLFLIALVYNRLSIATSLQISFWLTRNKICKIQATLAMSTSRISIYHLCRSDFSFPTFFLYISLHFNSVYVENG